MPNTPQVVSLHTPMTNIVATESTVNALRETIGSAGVGEEQEIDETEGTELVPRIIREMGMVQIDFKAPDTTGLADIGVASFQPVPLREAIIGTDERIQVKDNRKYPWRASASLLITAADNSQWVGSAWFISPRTLITAGHCVYIKHSDIPGRDGWVKKIQVMPGRNGNELPFGGITASEFWTVQGWGDKGLENYDYGAIILPAAFPQELGTFGYGVYPDDELNKLMVNVAGYPSDKSSGTIWYDKRNVGTVKADKVYYAADTYGGQSGTVVYRIKDRKRIAVAIHAYGGLTANSGTRITDQVYNNLESWKRD
ncbi:serine protease [Chitinophaga agrisoli]|uniref:Serine protease n=1 Tax=Chitinophaga agrisoli TaxID=2607653 RepID=A0A5B2VJM7_9BACT|nr:serine protease [Chitinophaga agrisoli]KAA2238780.1 serine protease [Chitinophaga agrisoli]